MTITEKRKVFILNSWIKISDDCLKEYLSRELELTDKGQVKSTTTNIITAIVNSNYCVSHKILNGSIFFDTCSQTIRLIGSIKGENEVNLKAPRKWTDQLTNLLGVEIEMNFGIKYSKGRMEEAVIFIANKRRVNLPKLYMKSLKYDGEDYISKLLPKYLGADDTFLNHWIMEHMLIGMVNRVFHPGCKFDEIMVLTGEQGVGKTSFIEKLALLPDWYCSLNNIKGKDAVSNLVGKIVVELEEFVALRNAKTADEAKLFISTRTSTVRLSYERFSADVDRTCIMIATTNDMTFLGDFSGERRYLPVQVHKEKVRLPVMYDQEKFPQLKGVSREEYSKIVKKDFEGAVAQAVYLFENNLYSPVLPVELRKDLNQVIQMHKNENRHVQNFFEFMEWKDTKSDTPNRVCSGEFLSQYPQTNEKIFAELMANEMADEWELEPTDKSRKFKIDGRVRVSKKFYVRKNVPDFIEITEDIELPF